MKVLDFEGLRERGIRFHRVHIYRLIKQGRFPRPIKIGGNTTVWPEHEIDQYIKTCIARRDAALTEK